jgi:hypothetical protein
MAPPLEARKNRLGSEFRQAIFGKIFIAIERARRDRLCSSDNSASG